MLTFLKRVLGVKELPDELSYEDARGVLEAHSRRQERELAGRSDTKPEILYYLADRGDPSSRRAVAANPVAPAPANRLLADDTDVEVRSELARKVGRLLPDLLASEVEAVCTQTLETLEKLAQDQLPRVRAIIANEIKSLDCVPPEIIRALARDAEAMVATPILEYSPLLSDNDLLEIVATARVRAGLAAIARRRGLSEDVSEAIASSLDVVAVEALLSNPDAAIREQTMEALVDRAGTVVSWHGALVRRTGLSLRVLRRVAGFVGASLLEQIVDRHDLDDETRTHIQRCLRKCVEKIGPQAGNPEEKARKAMIDQARSEGTVDEGLLEQVIETGDRKLVAETLSQLCKTDRSIIDKVFETRSAKGLTAVVWYAGLTMRISFKIQSQLLKMPANELLPARAGVAFPLSEDEMRWHLSYFGIGGPK